MKDRHAVEGISKKNIKNLNSPLIELIVFCYLYFFAL